GKILSGTMDKEEGYQEEEGCGSLSLPVWFFYENLSLSVDVLCDFWHNVVTDALASDGE
ncbi:hypothetical protein L195_g051412, partial [Trifolium pratense]